MPTLAPTPPHNAIVRNIGFLMEDASCGNGVEARLLSKVAEKAQEHWLERAEMLVASMDSDESAYEHVAIEPKSIVRVRYKFVGRLKPRRFASDD